MLFEGVHVPLCTPFYPDGRLNLRKLEHNVRKLSLTPVSGLIALGANGETALLSSLERVEVLRTVGGEAAPEKVLTAGIGLPGVRESLALADASAAANFDAVLVDAPLEYAPLLRADDGPTPAILTYFRAIADSSPLPVLLASDANRAPLPVALIAELASHRNVIGLVECSSHIGRVAQVREACAQVRRTVSTTTTFTAATGRMLRPAANTAARDFVSAADLAGNGGGALAVVPPMTAMKTRSREVGFQIVWASAQNAVSAIRAGAASLAMPLAAAVPQAAFELWAAWKDGDEALMQAKQGRLASAEEGIAPWDIPAIKAASEFSGYFGGRPRLPLLGVSSERSASIAKLLGGMKS